jgi:pilus assembly protein Flp/PilA
LTHVPDQSSVDPLLGRIEGSRHPADNQIRTDVSTFAIRLKQIFWDQDGQGLTEYALILGLMAVVSIAALSLVGGAVSDILSTIADSL